MCIDIASVGGAGCTPATIRSGRAPKCFVRNGLKFRTPSNELASQPPDPGGKTDFISPLACALSHLGGAQSPDGPKIELGHPLPEAAPMKQSNKAPVFLTSEKVKMVHEPNEGEGCIPVDMSKHKVFKEKFPDPEVKWDGGWYGDETSRIEYLKQHGKLWGFCRPEQCKRKTNVFFIPKKDGRLRKILACVNFNNCCEQPPKCRLPGTWNIQKIRFKNKRFFSAESDVSAYYSRLQAPDWMKYFLCLDEVRIGDVIEMDDDGVYTCPYTQETFGPNDRACPCWPRLPMGWNWSVFYAVEIAEELLEKAQEKMRKDKNTQTTSLNIPKRAPLESSDGPFQGTYIDNLFSLGVDPDVVNEVQKLMKEEFEARGLIMSENDLARVERQLLGILLKGEENKLEPPEKFIREVAYVAGKKRIRVWEFDKIMGKCAWIFPLHRRFFSILQECYRLLTQVRRGLDSGKIKDTDIIHLSKEVRTEFRTVWALSGYLFADLTARNAECVFACDSSLEGYAVMDADLDPDREWIHDTGLVHTSFAARVLRRKRWRLRRQKWFRYELKMILNGEICAFRHAARMAAAENPGKEIIIYTDNSNVFHAIQKGRSRSKPLNILCRNVLFLEILHGVRIHARWIPSADMPADKYTRRATFPGNKYK